MRITSAPIIGIFDHETYTEVYSPIWGKTEPFKNTSLSNPFGGYFYSEIGNKGLDKMRWNMYISGS